MTRPSAGAGPADRLRPAAWAVLAVGAAVVAGLATSGTAGVTVTRAAADVAAVGCVGLALVAVLLPDADGRAATGVRTTVDRGLLALGGAWVVLLLLGIMVRSADAFGRTLDTLGGAEVWRWSTQLAAGRGLVLTIGCAAVVAGCAAFRLHQWRVRGDPERIPARIPLVAALLGVLTPTVTGHAGSAPDHQLAVITAALHAGAAALWVGGLAGLLVLVARHRTLLDATLPRFSAIAGFCVVTVAVTGVLAAYTRMPGWGGLFGTGYGLLVVAKAVGLAALAGLGAIARRRLAAGRTPVLRWAGLEVGLMAVTLGLAATLTQTAP